MLGSKVIRTALGVSAVTAAALLSSMPTAHAIPLEPFTAEAAPTAGGAGSAGSNSGANDTTTLLGGILCMLTGGISSEASTVCIRH
ncbi:hypothetical protein [Nocardia sp. NPDC052566]|uniref:hypothetical protein n=1 Tax=Nocardia sp. NPDC052566 TaxID=3364330 RepID=UPI0037CA1E4A